MRKKKLFVVGYDMETEPIFGKECILDGAVFPRTQAQALKDLKLFDQLDNPVIYKLVKVDPKKI